MKFGVFAIVAGMPSVVIGWLSSIIMAPHLMAGAGAAMRGGSLVIVGAHVPLTRPLRARPA